MTAIAVGRATRGGGERFMSGRALAWLDAADEGAADACAGPMLDLSRDELDWPAAPHIARATIAALDRGETHYTDRTGIAPLREAVAARCLAEDGVGYAARGEVLICGGGHEALFVAIQMLVEPGDEVLVPDPAPRSIAEGVRLAGGTPVTVPTAAADEFALTAAAVRGALSPRTRVLIFASPATPTGGVTTGGELAALAAVARDYNLRVIVDETYRQLVFDGPPQQSLAALPGMRERTVVVGSFSSRYAMAGWRAGYVVGPAALLRPITLMKQALTICSPAPSQWAALAALTGPQDEAEALVREVAARRTAVAPALAALGLRVHGRGTPFLFVDTGSTGLDGRGFVALALGEAGVRLVAGEAFGPGGVGFVRLTLAAPVSALQEAVARLATVIGRCRAMATQRKGDHRWS